MGGKGEAKGVRLHFQPVAQIHVLAGVDDALGKAHRIAALAENLFRRLAAGVHQLPGRNHLVGKADPICLLRINPVTGEDQLLGPSLADQPGQPLGAAKAGDDAKAALRLAEHGVVRGNANVAAHADFAPAAQRVAVDRGNRHLGHILQLVERLHGQKGHRAALGGGGVHHLRDVRAGHKGLAAGASEDHNPHILSLFQTGKALPQLGQRLCVQGVESLGTVDGHSCNLVKNL